MNDTAHTFAHLAEVVLLPLGPLSVTTMPYVDGETYAGRRECARLKPAGTAMENVTSAVPKGTTVGGDAGSDDAPPPPPHAESRPIRPIKNEIRVDFNTKTPSLGEASEKAVLRRVSP